ncbi:MAG: zinc dependent phospholipase C family protein, partial [Hyphomicrobiaceae bacterium]|nr:zinc dependent phospholipase C family protein [Hyphomicrobiaceae bacterium]
MTLLFRIIYAAHASGTHHKLALDALRTLECEGAENWRRLFLAHAETYLEGAKAPDKQFKDFKNHVLHVRDNFWGGAPEKAESWYKLLVRALKDGNWNEVAWTAGILSHYYTDPIHPFHTAQSDAENNIHRAVEWSISKSYDALRARGLTGPQPAIALGSDEHWLKDLVIAGAETSNRYYETLIARYDFARGVVEPPEGLDDPCRAAIGELLVYAATGFGKILDRAIAEAGVTPPEVPITVATVVAAFKMPLKWVTKKLDDAADRRQVEAIYDELMSTGTVDASLPEDDRQVRDLYEREVKPLRDAARIRDRVRRRETAPRPQGMFPAVARNVPVSQAQAPAPSQTLAPAPSQTTTGIGREGPSAQPPSLDPERVPHPFDAHVVNIVTMPPARDDSGHAPRFYLAAKDDIEAAPSIGPRTGQRLRDIGISTVAGL